eukprot:m.165920 g.165920  ORF g.165920 m.165920 type:complete len:335 (-) comp15268_c0_seq15:890-1894(-)
MLVQSDLREILTTRPLVNSKSGRLLLRIIWVGQKANFDPMAFVLAKLGRSECVKWDGCVVGGVFNNWKGKFERLFGSSSQVPFFNVTDAPPPTTTTTSLTTSSLTTLSSITTSTHSMTGTNTASTTTYTTSDIQQTVSKSTSPLPASISSESTSALSVSTTGDTVGTSHSTSTNNIITTSRIARSSATSPGSSNSNVITTETVSATGASDSSNASENKSLATGIIIGIIVAILVVIVLVVVLRIQLRKKPEAGPQRDSYENALYETQTQNQKDPEFMLVSNHTSYPESATQPATSEFSRKTTLRLPDSEAQETRQQAKRGNNRLSFDPQLFDLV